MQRKPTRRRIRRRATRNRLGGTVYQNDRALDSAITRAITEAATDQDTLSPTEVGQAMVALLDQCGWQRLEARRGSGPGSVVGYCVDDQGRQLQVADLIGTSASSVPSVSERRAPVADAGTPGPADVVQAMAALLHRSGWRRLEIVRGPSGVGPVNGYCVDGTNNP